MKWPIVKLGDCMRLINGRAYLQHELLDEGTPIIRIQNLNGGERWYYSNLELPAEKYCTNGDLLFAWSATFGPYVWRGEKSIYHYHIWKIEPFSNLDKKFAYHILLWITNSIKRAAHGASMLHMTKAGMEKWEIPLPPLAEQQRIAALLDTADNLVRLREAAIEKLDQLIRSVFIEMFGSVRENTKNWPLKSFAELAINEDYKRRPIKSSDRENRNGEYAYYGASGIIDSIDDYIFEGESLLIGEDGANLLARSSPIAFMANGKYWVNNHAHILREHESASLRYLEFFVDQIDLSPYITGSAQPKLTRANLDRIPVPLPPRSLQNRFAEIVKNIERQREAAIIHCEKALGLSKTLQYQSFAVN